MSLLDHNTQARRLGRQSPVAVVAALAFRRLGLLPTAAVASVFLAGAASIAAGPSEGSPSEEAECPAHFVIDFAGLSPGTVLGEQYADVGVHIFAVANGAGYPNAAIVFDSNAPPTHDPDLGAHVGNIAILAKNLDDADNDGLVDDPDENDFGGRQIYVFDQPVRIDSFLFIDKDHGVPDRAVAFDSSGETIMEAPIPLAGNGSVQSIAINADGVRRLEIVYRDSGALTGIEFGCQPTLVPSPTPTPAPTSAPGPTPSPTPSDPPVVPQLTPPPVLSITRAPEPTPTSTPAGLGIAGLPGAGGWRGLTDPSIELALGFVIFVLLAAELMLLMANSRDRR